MPSTFEGMSVDPLLRVTPDADKGLKVIETEWSPVAPGHYNKLP